MQGSNRCLSSNKLKNKCMELCGEREPNTSTVAFVALKLQYVLLMFTDLK